MKYRYLLVTLLLMLIPSVLMADKIRRAYKGIIIVENDSTIRAMEPYGGATDGIEAYADVVNKYQRQFPDVRIFCMPIPNAVAFYCPDSMAEWTKPEHEAITHLISRLEQKVRAIDLVPVLTPHVTEPIYLRTDHHWSPLGAYYAAQELAQAAEVPFMALDCYEPDTIRNFVGTMRQFSRDKAVGQHPEDFVFYKPQGVDYSATHVRYYNTTTRRHRRRYRVLRARPEESCQFFKTFPDGSPGAYGTFMGGDLNTTSVRTSTDNGRRLLILKDSYGNALPGYLFGSFEEIHVIDCRYFLRNICQFIEEHKITDVLFANNLIHASTPKISQNYDRFLTQK